MSRIRLHYRPTDSLDLVRLLREDIEAQEAIQFDCFVDPLTYGDLVSIRFDQRPVVNMRFRNMRALGDENDGDDGKRWTSTPEISMSLIANTVALVTGGWYPPMFAVSGRRLLLDKCAVCEIEACFLDGRKRPGRPDGFLDFLAERPVNLHLGLYALEGNKRRTPSAEELEQLLEEAERKVKRALPQAIIEPSDRSASIRGAMGMIDDRKELFQREVEFLLTVAPTLATSIAASKRLDEVKRLREAVERHRLPRQSMVALAALSALVQPQAENPAKGLLKPAQGYDAESAYNALFDLCALELLVSGAKLFPDRPPALLTRDRDLALFWTGLNTEWHAPGDGSEEQNDGGLGPLFSGLSREAVSAFFDERR